MNCLFLYKLMNVHTIQFAINICFVFPGYTLAFPRWKVRGGGGGGGGGVDLD